jgi:guanylate kinase
MNMKKIKLIALFGPAGAGKDLLQGIMVKNHAVHGVIHYTSRPIRDNEENGVAYNFVEASEFIEMICAGQFVEHAEFNNWYYGTSIDSFSEDKINIGAFSISGIEQLLADGRVEVHPVYICVPDKLRLLRQLNRETNPNCYEICRRLLSDDADFKNINFEYDLLMNVGSVSNVEEALVELLTEIG